jgi:hypothetical protein
MMAEIAMRRALGQGRSKPPPEPRGKRAKVLYHERLKRSVAETPQQSL